MTVALIESIPDTVSVVGLRGITTLTTEMVLALHEYVVQIRLFGTNMVDIPAVRAARPQLLITQ
jgi:hypothetical protein